MSLLFADLDTPDDIKANGDSLGGGRLTVDSDYYDLTIKLAYATTAASGARAINMLLLTKDNKDIHAQFWVCSGTEKGGKPYYIDKKTMEKRWLPGYELADNMCLLAVGKPLRKLETEEKVIDLYSTKERNEVPTKVDMFTELIGKEISAGILKQTVDKTTKNEASGMYEATGETRTENEIDKFFRSRDGLTVAEITARLTEPKFKQIWLNKWKDQVKDKSTGAAGTPGAPKVQRKAAAPAAPDPMFI